MWLAKNKTLVTTSETKPLSFNSILRLIEIISKDKWDTKGRVYAEKLATSLEKEGYTIDAKLVRETIKMMNGEKVALAVME